VVDVGNDGEIADVLHAVILCHRVPFVGIRRTPGLCPGPAQTLFEKRFENPKNFQIQNIKYNHIYAVGA
jgi:hypothetical protein